MTLAELEQYAQDNNLIYNTMNQEYEKFEETKKYINSLTKEERYHYTILWRQTMIDRLEAEKRRLKESYNRNIREINDHIKTLLSH